MNILKELYYKKLAENEVKVQFWEDYLKSLNTLDFSLFSDKLTVPLLVPIGSRIFFRGALKHTNEITVSLGADYFAKCSLHQAEILRLHRIKDAESKLQMFKKERQYLESQVTFGKEKLFGNAGTDIVEVHTKEEDKAWREKHRENVKKSKQRKDITEEFHNSVLSDEALWNRLEQLELQEELENELNNFHDDSNREETDYNQYNQNKIDFTEPQDLVKTKFNPEDTSRDSLKLESNNKQSTQSQLLQQVLNKQNELEQKLADIKNRDRGSSKTESDLMSRLDKMEQLEELEDELDRIDDIINEDTETSEVQNSAEGFENSKEIKRFVSFADEDESETLEINFKHSDVQPCTEPYDPDKGIIKPSDIYTAFSHMFTETTSILRKTKYEINKSEPKTVQNHNTKPDILPNIDDNAAKTIIVKDISEKTVADEPISDSNNSRPMSIFKKRRQQK